MLLPYLNFVLAFQTIPVASWIFQPPLLTTRLVAGRKSNTFLTSSYPFRRVPRRDSSRTTTTLFVRKMTTTTEEREEDQTIFDDAPVWDPIQQIYVGGRVPDSTGNILEAVVGADGSLPIFGYGSLCWKPGGILADPAVKQSFGKAIGYRRCWCQKSTDHRGWPHFPGIVCTLLQDAEVATLLQKEPQSGISTPVSRTEGVLYTVPAHLVQACLDELDFREKGGYAREVIDVVLDDTGETVRAALYRGTVDNPAIWPRVLRDHVYAAAVLRVAVGPSGPNTEYLHNLFTFLQQHRGRGDGVEQSSSVEDTFDLTHRVDAMIGQQPFFLYGCGSNQHNQLLLHHYADYLRHGEEAHSLTEILLLANATDKAKEMPTAVYAGGGHSALMTDQNRLFLFGWNENEQCGKYSALTDEPCRAWEVPFAVQSCALGFGHSLFLDLAGKLFAMGDNAKGQVTGAGTGNDVAEPIIPTMLENTTVVTMAAGLFHSAAVTIHGSVIEWGGGKPDMTWTPRSRAIGVACGRKYTVAFLADGTIWSWGRDNKYGQLGRVTAEGAEISNMHEPTVLQIPWSPDELQILDIQTGWSHTVVMLEDIETKERILYGWGRNDKGQLGLGHTEHVFTPTRLTLKSTVQSFSCGSEFTFVVSGKGGLWACGWNEHGNLGYSHDMEYSESWRSIKHGRLVQPPCTNPDNDSVFHIAAGGSHVLVTLGADPQM